MSDTGKVIGVRLPTETSVNLDRVVELERKHARSGHKVTRHALLVLAVEMFVTQRLRRSVSRETEPETIP